MNRIRIAASLTVILGVIYGFSGLMVSVTEFGIGLAVAGVGGLVYGLADYIDGWDK